MRHLNRLKQNFIDDIKSIASESTTQKIKINMVGRNVLLL